MRWFLLFTLGCSGGDDDTDAVPDPYPLDDVLTFAHVQAVGTHNSYHVQTTPIPEWDYTHAPLDVQLGEQGVRQFELDLYLDQETGLWRVFHVVLIDEGSTCDAFADCLDTLATWSAENPGHHPLFVLLEVKEELGPGELDEAIDSLEAEISAAFGDEQLVLPRVVQGSAPDLRTRLATDGWPTLGEQRGQTLFVLHVGGALRDAHVARPVDDWVMWPDAQGDPDQPWSAVHTMNDAFDPRIADVVATDQLVRTRTDSDGNEARANDTTKRDAALASGAHFVSTDFPVPHPETGYVVALPGGTPSRCNPVTAPPECTPEAVESPARLAR